MAGERINATVMTWLQPHLAIGLTLLDESNCISPIRTTGPNCPSVGREPERAEKKAGQFPNTVQLPTDSTVHGSQDYGRIATKECCVRIVSHRCTTYDARRAAYDLK